MFLHYILMVTYQYFKVGVDLMFQLKETKQYTFMFSVMTVYGQQIWMVGSSDTSFKITQNSFINNFITFQELKKPSGFNINQDNSFFIYILPRQSYWPTGRWYHHFTITKINCLVEIWTKIYYLQPNKISRPFYQNFSYCINSTVPKRHRSSTALVLCRKNNSVQIRF